MAYGLKYTGYKQRGTDRVTVNIYAKDWTGTTYELATLTGLSLQIQGAQGTPYSPLIKTSVAIALRDAFDEGSTASDGTTCIKNGGKWGQWEEFYTNDSTKFRVELKHGSTVIWKGYITPDSWGEDMTYRGVINLTARDMLGALSEKEFDLTGAVSIRDIVEGAMTAGEIPMAVSFEDDECPINSNDENILDATVQASVFGGKSWYEALERTLESTGLVLRYDGQGGFYVTSLRYAYSHATATVTPQFTGGSGYRSLDPAARQIVDTFNPKFTNYESKDADSTRFLIQTGTYDQTYRAGSQTVTYHSLRKYQVSADTGGNGWRGDLATLPTVSVTGRPGLNLCIPTDCDNTGYIEYRDSALSLPMAVTIDALLIDTGTTWAIEQSGAIKIKTITLQVRATVSGQTRYLADTGAWSAAENTLTFAPKEKITIPTLAGASNLAVRIIKVETECAVLPSNALVAAPVLTFSAPEYSDLAGEYKTTTIYNESNHIEINRKPEIGSANTVLSPVIASNILAFDGVAAPDEWGFSDMNGHYPLAVLVQAQLLVFYAAQNGNSIFTGSFVQSDKRTALPGKNYTYYQRSCAMLAGTFDFINGTAQSVTLREIAQWSDIWESFDPDWTQRESAQTGGTAASGGGTSGGGGGQGGGGSVTSVALTMPTGFSVQGSPITRSGEFQVGFAEGYSLLTPEARAILDRFEYNATTHTLIVKKDGNNDVNFAAYGEVTAGGVGGDTPVATTTLGGLLNVTSDADDKQTEHDVILVRRKNATGGNSWTLADLSSIGGGNVDAIKMNGTRIDPVNKIVDLGTVITSLSGYATENWVLGKNYLTSHQSVTLASGTNNGTLKLTTNAGTVDNIAVKGLAALAFKASLVASDIPSLDWSKIATGKPTTISGYGITDAYTKTQIDAKTITVAGTALKFGDSISANTIVGAATSAATFAGTAAKATILATARSIWGHNFDGSAAISGDMSSVGKMTFTAKTSAATSGNVLEVVTLNGVTYLHTTLPFFSDSEITAGGVGSGGGGGVNYLYMLEDVPDYRTSYRGKYLRAKSDGSGVEWVDVQGGVTSFNSRTGAITLTLADVESVLNLTPIENAIKSLQSQVDSVSARDGFDELIATSLFADTLVGTNIYGTLHGNADSATNADTLDGQHASYFQPLATAINTGNIASQSVAYATGAGNADTVDGEHSSAFAHIGAHNNLTASGNEFTFASSGFSGAIYLNYRTAGGTNGNITDYIFSNGKGGTLTNLSTLITKSNLGETAYNDLTKVSQALQSLQSQVDSVASRDNADFEVLEGVVNECFRSLQSQIDSVATKTDMSEINAVSVHADNLSAVDMWASGNILTYGEVTAGQSSDSRFKDNQQLLRNADRVLKSLRPMEFDWNELYHSLGGQNKGHDVGFLAQDIQPLIPSAIGKVYGDYLRLDYNKVTPYLVSGWQSHETRIEYLERRVNELERQLHINS